MLAWVMLFAQTLPLMANPIDGVVSGGSANISSNGSTLTVTQQSNKAVIDWRGFDIAHGETTNFVQPSASSMTLNRVNSNSPSFINGNLNANGNLILVNPNGVWFGGNARVDVNSLIATTAGISNDAFMNSDGKLNFDIAGNPDAAVVNNGLITAKEAGLVGLVAPNVINNGVIIAKLGRVHLASGDTAAVDMYGDGLLTVAVSDKVKKQLVENNGLISAAGGTIAMTAAAGKDVVNSLVKVSGELHAPSIKQRNGKIIIAAEGSNAVKGNIAANKGKKTGSSTVLVDGVLNASGRNSGERGGSITVTGDNIALMDGTVLDASGSDGASKTTFNQAVSAYRNGAAGGDILVGGDYLGKGDTATAKNLYVSAGTLILNDALNSGDAGRSIFWSDNTTSFLGNVYARALGGKAADSHSWHAVAGGNSGDGGFVETSGHGHLDAGGYVDLTASNGARGTYFLDPTNITIYGNYAPNYGTVIQGDSSTLASTLKLWLDAKQITGLSDGASVTTWSDLSGNANHATGGTSPTYSATGLNGQASVSFGVNSQLIAPAFTVGSIFVVGKSNNATFANYEGLVGGPVTDPGNGHILNGWAGSTGIYKAGSGTFYNSWQNGGLAASGIFSNINASSGWIGSFVTSTPTTTNTAIWIGYISGGSRGWNGLLGETIIYSNTLSTNARNLNEQYQSMKWGIALTPPGSGATEAAQATASIQKGDAADGYSVFTTRYLEHLSQSANISLQASNNITLDLQGDTMNFSTAGRTLTLTAGNQITTASTGTITTNGAAISMYANDSIVFGHALTLNTNGGAVLLNADRDNSGAGAIKLTSTTINSSGGNVTMGGGNGTITACTGYAVGSGSYEDGILMTGGAVNAAGGHIIMNGRSAVTGNSFISGVSLDSGANVNTNNSGSISLYGSGNTGSGTSNRGVRIVNGATVSAQNGNITLNGTGGGSGTSANNYGVFLGGSGGFVSTNGSGNINVTGAGGNLAGSGGVNYGVYISTAGSYLKTLGTGSINITGTKGGQSSSYGFLTDIANAVVTAGTAGNIQLLADTVSFSGAGGGNNISSVGSLTIAPLTAVTMGIGSSATATLNLTDTALAAFNAASYSLGSGTATGVRINTSKNFGASNVVFTSGGLISLVNTLTTTSGNITFNNAVLLTGATTINAGTGTVTFASTVNSANQVTSANVLVVAGGGGGGGGTGGGGGGGGVLNNTSYALTTNSSVTVTVGSGGAASSGINIAGTSGGNSVFGTMTATGGGGGGANNGINGLTGGSGGGGSWNSIGGTGTAGQGNAGAAGASAGAPNYGAGGGGGAGSAGTIGTTTTGGNGGSGIANSITGSSVTYAGGGGGGVYAGGTIGTGGTGGGGNGGSNALSGTAGAANTGGGGGGAGNNSGNGGAGGSGVVIVRYTGAIEQATITGTATSATVGNDTVWTFTSSGTFVANSVGCTGGCNLTINAGTATFGGAIGGTSALGALAITTTNTVALPAVTASSINVVTSGGAANISLGGALNASAASGSGITLNAGNQIVTTATGSMTANTSNTSLTAANGIAFAHTYSLNSNTGNIALNSATTHSAALTISAGTGTITTGSSVTSTASNLTLKSDNMTIGGALAGSGTLYIAPGTNNRTMNFGTPTGALDWDVTELGYISSSKSVTIGLWGTTTGDVYIGGFSLNNNTQVYNMGNIIVSGAVNFMGKNVDLAIGSGDIDINAALTSAGGSLTIRSGAGGNSIMLAGGAGNITLTAAQLDNITDGWGSINFGNSVQPITASTYSNWRDPVYFNSGTSTTTISGAQSTAAGSNANFTFNGPTTFNGNIDTTNSSASAGVGTITLGNYAHTLAANLLTRDANITTNGTISVASGARRLSAGSASYSSTSAMLTINNTISGAGTIALNGNDIDINADITTADIQLRPTLNNTVMGLAGGAGVTQLTSAELDHLKPTSSLTIGSVSAIGAWGGTMNIGAYTWNQTPISSLIFRSDTAMNFLGAQNYAAVTNAYGIRYYTNNYNIADTLTTAIGRTLSFTGSSVTLNVGQGAAAAGIDSTELDLISNGWTSLTFGGETPTTNLLQYSNWRDPVIVQANGTLTISGTQTAAAGSNTTFLVNLGYSAGGSTNINADIDMRPATGGTGSITLTGATHYGQGSAHLVSANLYSGSGGISIDKSVNVTGTASTHQYFNAGTGTITITDNGTNRRGSITATNQYLRLQADDFAIAGAINGTSNAYAWFETNSTSRSMGLAGATGQAQLGTSELDLVTGFGRVDFTSGTGGTNMNSRTWSATNASYFFNSTGLESILQNQSFASNVYFQAPDYTISANLTQTGSGNLYFPTGSNSGGLTLGGGAGTTILDSNELDRIIDGWAGVEFGLGQGNNITLQAYSNWRDPVSFTNAGDLTVSGAQGVGASSNASMLFDQRGVGRTTTINANVDNSAGSGGMTFTAASGAGSTVHLGANLTSANGITINRPVTLTGTAGTTRTITTGTGTLTTSAAGTLSAADKHLKVVADDVSLMGGISGTGNLTFNPYTTGRAMNIGSGTGGLNLSGSELGLFADGFNSIIFDSNNGNSAVTLGANNWLDNLIVTTKNANITVAGATSSTASGDAILLSTTANFINNVGAGALTAGSGRWLVYSTNPSSDTINSLSNNFRRFSCTYGGSCPSFPGTGNGFLYSITPTVTATPNALSSIVYGAATPSLTNYAYTLSGYLGSDASADSVTGTLNGSTSYSAGSSVNNYAINHASGTLSSAMGYAFSYANNASGITVTQRAITLTADAKTKVYGSADPSLTYQLTSGALYGSDSITGALSRTAGETVAGGPYAINQNTLTAGGNYNITYVGNSLSITRAGLTVNANARTKVYGSADPALTYTYSGLTNGDTASVFSGALSRTAGETVAGGPYAINQNTLTAGGNYNITYTGNNLSITPAPLSVSAAAKSKVYGSSDPSLTYTYSGLTNGDTASVFSGALSRTAGETVAGGPYAINQNTLDAGSNYTISYTGNNLSITPATLNINAVAKTKLYGSSDPSLTYTYSGLANGDTASILSGHLSRDAGENIGRYSIHQHSLAANSNYTINYTGAQLNINSSIITIIADSIRKKYGMPDPELTYTVSGLSTSDAAQILTGSLMREAGSNPGVYRILQNTLSTTANYMLHYIGGDFVIAERELPQTVIRVSQDPTLNMPEEHNVPGNNNAPSNNQAAELDNHTQTNEPTSGAQVNVGRGWLRIGEDLLRQLNLSNDAAMRLGLSVNP